jgi:hypothetical protein
LGPGTHCTVYSGAALTYERKKVYSTGQWFGLNVTEGDFEEEKFIFILRHQHL